ncbi:MAG: hypothetical protein WCS31_17180, partial [Verrucomicrobiae bacterium]
HSIRQASFSLPIEDRITLYAAMDRLPPRPPRIEIALATRHFHKGALVLYAITSSYFEGNSSPLALLGVSRDLPGPTPSAFFGIEAFFFQTRFQFPLQAESQK